MNFINKAYAQIGDLFRSMTPGARIAAGLLLALVIISVAYLVRQGTGGPDEFLMGGESFPAGDLKAMEAAFAKANLDGYQVEGARIRVPRGKRSAYMGALADGGALPADFGSHLRKALDTGGGMFISQQEREQRFKVAVQDELAGIIRGMKDIEKASVIYDMKTKPGLGRETIGTATASVKPVGSQLLERDRVRDIRHLVASAVAGLHAHDVTVVDLNGHTYPATGADGGDPDGDDYLRRQQAHEQHIRDKILRSLSKITGVEVTVNVELDTKIRDSTRKVAFDKTGTVAVATRERSTEKTTDSGNSSGPPGTRSNTANTGASLVARDTAGGTETVSSLDQTNQPGGSESTTEQIGLTPKRVTVSVGIPKGYYAQIWRERNNVTDEEQKPQDNELNDIRTAEETKIRQYVAAVLPYNPNQLEKDPVEMVTVKMFDDFAVPAIAEPGLSENMWAWVGQNWSTLGMTFLGLVGLLMFRSMVRTAPNPQSQPQTAAATTPATTSTATIDETSPSEPAPAHENRLRKRRTFSGPSLRDDLSEMVREDTDAAAGVLRAWIGKAN